MNETQMMLTAIRTVRNQALALVDACDLVLELAARPVTSSEEDKSGTCTHPPRFRTMTPTMGKPNRFLCGKCKAIVEG